jgi:TRAP-type C4-dicarboxylate transport system permease small subunit
MIELLASLGRPLLFTIPPGAPFVLVAGGGCLGALAIRAGLARSAPGRAWLEATARTEHVALTLLLVAMVVVSLAQIVLRNVFHTGWVWVDPLLRHAVLWIGFMGAALAAAADRHISIDVLSRFMAPGVHRGVHAVLRTAAAMVALLLANATYLLLRDEFEFGSTAFLSVPTWMVMAIMPMALLVVAYRFVHSAWRGPVPGPPVASP